MISKGLLQIKFIRTLSNLICITYCKIQELKFYEIY